MYMYIYKYSRNEFSRRRGRYCKNNGPPTRNRENDHGGCDAHSARHKYLPESWIDKPKSFSQCEPAKIDNDARRFSSHRVATIVIASLRAQFLIDDLIV